MTKQTHQVTGNAGLFYASWRLSQLGWNVVPTARNTRGVDLMACNGNFTKSHAVQVKALTSRRSPVPLGSTLDKVMGDWWLIVVGVHEVEPCVYVLTPAEVRAAAACNKSGAAAYWLGPKHYQLDEYRNAFDRLGASDE